MANIGDDIYASLAAAGFTGSLVDKLKKFWSVTAERGLALGSALTVLSSSAVAASVTGTTNETTLATINIPAGTIGPWDRDNHTRELYCRGSLWRLVNLERLSLLQGKLVRKSFLLEGRVIIRK